MTSKPAVLLINICISNVAYCLSLGFSEADCENPATKIQEQIVYFRKDSPEISIGKLRTKTQKGK
jgi:hypothetical protein